MRVVHLTPSFLPIIGGTEFYIANLSLSLKKYGITSEVISLSYKRRCETVKILKQDSYYGIKRIIWPSCYLGIIRLPLKTHFLPFHVEILKKHLNGFSIIHMHDDVDLSFPFTARKIKRPKVFSCHSLPYWMKYYRFNTLARELLRCSADLYHVFSQRDMKFLLEIGIPEEKLIVIPHGVDIETFKPKDTKTQRIINDVHIGFLGRIVPQKGIITFLKAIKLLKNHNTLNIPIKVSIAGPIVDMKYFHKLVEYVRIHQLRNVVFYGPVADAHIFLQNLDIFIFPSLEETFGLTLLEAMACGLPVIATKIEPVSKIVLEGKTGFLVPPNNHEVLAEKIRILIEDDNLRKNMSIFARQVAENNYSMEKHCQKILTVYQLLLERVS